MKLMIERQLAKLLEGTADPAFAVDLQGEIRTWNKAAEKLFGFSADLAVGKPCAEIVHGSLAAEKSFCREECDVLECMRKGCEISNFDMKVKTCAGQLLWVNVSMLSTSDERTGRQLAVHFMRDISARKKTEELAKKMLKMARELVNDTHEPGSSPPVAPLTAQETKILRLLAAGKNTKDLTAELQITLLTLRNHISNINRKLHTRSRIESVAEALKRRLI